MRQAALPIALRTAPAPCGLPGHVRIYLSRSAFASAPPWWFCAQCNPPRDGDVAAYYEIDRRPCATDAGGKPWRHR